jgi:hypothetical protein
MKISSHDGKIKRTARRLGQGAALTFLLNAAACAPVVAQAPFPARDDTVQPGDLLGPFDGKVVDAVSGKPVAQAIVQVTWGFEIGRGLTAPAGAAVRTVETASDGSYTVPRLDDEPYRRRVASMSLIVYKRGFIGYRSDRVFEDLRRRTDFVQQRNLVKLERMPSAISHVRHVRFVGGTGALRQALGSEVVEASLELLEGPPPSETGHERARTAAGPALNAAGLLSEDELRAVTGFTGVFVLEKLGDLPSSATYDSRHFKAAGKPETFDAALRVWRLSSETARTRYQQLLKEVPHAEPRDEIADHSLRGYEGRIVAVAAIDEERGVVVELTCGLNQCRDADQAAALLKRIMARVDRLSSSAPPEKDQNKDENKKEAPAEEPDTERFQLRSPELKR